MSPTPNTYTMVFNSTAWFASKIRELWHTYRNDYVSQLIGYQLLLVGNILRLFLGQIPRIPDDASNNSYYHGSRILANLLGMYDETIPEFRNKHIYHLSMLDVTALMLLMPVLNDDQIDSIFSYITKTTYSTQIEEAVYNGTYGFVSYDKGHKMSRNLQMSAYTMRDLMSRFYSNQLTKEDMWFDKYFIDSLALGDYMDTISTNVRQHRLSIDAHGLFKTYPHIAEIFPYLT